MVLFIGRSFHKETGSADFFIALLKKRYDVLLCYPEDEGEEAYLRKLKLSDVAIVWQNEPAALIAKKNGCRVICISMFDGIETLPDRFWENLSGCRHISFSSELSERLVRLGYDTLHVRYFPQLKKRKALAEGVVAYFWERTPEYISFNDVLSFLPECVDTLIVHQSQNRALRAENKSTRVKIIHTSWSADENFHLENLSRAHLFIAPRLTEGIGMGFLEAMSYGICVIGNNKPTMNEYIENGKNGILIDYLALPVGRLSLTREQILVFADAAAAFLEEGRVSWLQDIEKIYAYIDSFCLLEEEVKLDNTGSGLYKKVLKNIRNVDKSINIMSLE